MNDPVNQSVRRSPAGLVVGVVWLGVILTGVVSVMRAFWFSPEFAAANAAREWPTVPGVVIVADPGRVPPAAGSLLGPTFDFFQYRYSVNGLTYTNNRLQWVYTYQPNETAWKFAHRWATQYPVGTNVTVYYSPADPQRSVLQPGADRSGAFTAGLVLSVFLTVVGLVGLYFIHAAAAFWSRQHGGSATDL
jgi:hypothetical protein